MYNSPNSLDINIKNTNNTNTHINFNFNIGSTLDKKYLSPPLKATLDQPNSITGRKIEPTNIINYESSAVAKYPILIEDSKQKVSAKAKPSLVSTRSPKIKNKSMGKLTTVKLQQKTKIPKKPMAFLSPPPPEKEKPRETLKDALNERSKGKKKSKKKSSSKKKKSQRSKELIAQNQTFRDMTQFQNFIRQNLQKHQMEKLIAEQRQDDQSKQKDIKQKSLHNLNQETRKLNSKFSVHHKPSSSSPKFPWGFNQKKYLTFFEKMTELNSQKSIRKKPNSLWLDDKTRRDRLGLGFLNEMNLEEFQKTLQKQKLEKSPDNEESKKQKPKESNPEILNWMNEKKRKLEEERWNCIKNMLEEQNRIRRNIQDLEMKVSNNRSSVKSSMNNNNNRSKYAKSYHNMGKQFQMEERKEPLLNEHQENKIYDMLQQQLHQMVYSSSRNEQEFSSARHAKSKSEDFQGKISQKKKMIQEQFQILSQKMANTLGVIKEKSKSPSPDQRNPPDFHQNNSKKPNSLSENISNPQMDRIKPVSQNENPRSKKGIRENASNNQMNMIKPENNEIKRNNQYNHNNCNNLNQQNNIRNNHHNQNLEQSPSISGPSVSETPYKQERNQQMNVHDDIDNFDSDEEKMMFIYNVAATIIQKVWRGFETRKLMNFYVLEAFNQMNPEITHSPDEKHNEMEDISTPQKPINKIMRRSHSLDEIYEPGNLFKEKDEKLIPKHEDTKMEGVFNEQEREELNKKLRLLNNKIGEDFDYYQLGAKNEEVQFDIKASENLQKVIDNNLFYGRKNELDGKNNVKIGEVEPIAKKDLDKSEHITNVSHLLEENKQIIVSDKNIQISNIASMNTVNNFQERKISLDHEPDFGDVKEMNEEYKQNNHLNANKNEGGPEMKWDEFLEYMKLCCQKKELNETASKFLDIIQKLPVDNIKDMISPSASHKDQEIQTNISPKNSEELEKKDAGVERPPRKSSKNLQIEIESEEENEKIAEAEKKAKKAEQNEQNIKNDDKNKEKNSIPEKKSLAQHKNKDKKFISNSEDNTKEKPQKMVDEEHKISPNALLENLKSNENSKYSSPLDQNALSTDNKLSEAQAIFSKIGDLRRAVGSEQLLRTQSLSWNPSPAGNKSPTIFEQEPFREFTNKKIREFLNKENMLNLIRFREKALLLRHQAQIDHMKRMLDNKRVSPRTFKSKSEEIEKWVNLEREDMLRKKIEIEKGWISAALTMKRTQRDLMFMRKSLGKQDVMEFKHSFSEEDFELFEGLEEKARSCLEIQQIAKLEIQDEVLKASNEKNKERENENFVEKNHEILVMKFNSNSEENHENFENNMNLAVNKQLTSESVNSNSPKILMDTLKNPLEPLKSLSEITKPSSENIKIVGDAYKQANLFAGYDPLKPNFDGLKINMDKSEEGKANNDQNIDILKQKIAEIPKFLSHDDFGNLSASSSLGSLSNSKSEVMFLTSKNKEVDRKIEQVAASVFEQLMDELKNEGKMFELLKGKKINIPVSQKSPKVGGFVAGKDIQEHFPPLNSPSREDVMGNKRFKDQILSPKNLSFIFFSEFSLFIYLKSILYLQ